MFKRSEEEITLEAEISVVVNYATDLAFSRKDTKKVRLYTPNTLRGVHYLEFYQNEPQDTPDSWDHNGHKEWYRNPLAFDLLRLDWCITKTGVTDKSFDHPYVIWFSNHKKKRRKSLNSPSAVDESGGRRMKLFSRNVVVPSESMEGKPLFGIGFLTENERDTWYTCLIDIQEENLHNQTLIHQLTHGPIKGKQVLGWRPYKHIQGGSLMKSWDFLAYVTGREAPKSPLSVLVRPELCVGNITDMDNFYTFYQKDWLRTALMEKRASVDFNMNLAISEVCYEGRTELLDVMVRICGKDKVIGDTKEQQTRFIGGNTHVHLAAYGGHLELIQRLCQLYGVSPGLRNERGETALFWAFSRGFFNPQVPRYLMKRSIELEDPLDPFEVHRGFQVSVLSLAIEMDPEFAMVYLEKKSSLKYMRFESKTTRHDFIGIELDAQYKRQMEEYAFIRSKTTNLQSKQEREDENFRSKVRSTFFRYVGDDNDKKINTSKGEDERVESHHWLLAINQRREFKRQTREEQLAWESFYTTSTEAEKMSIVELMVKHRRKGLLASPVVQQLFEIKWKCHGKRAMQSTFFIHLLHTIGISWLTLNWNATIMSLNRHLRVVTIGLAFLLVLMASVYEYRMLYCIYKQIGITDLVRSLHGQLAFFSFLVLNAYIVLVSYNSAYYQRPFPDYVDKTPAFTTFKAQAYLGATLTLLACIKWLRYAGVMVQLGPLIAMINQMFFDMGNWLAIMGVVSFFALNAWHIVLSVDSQWSYTYWQSVNWMLRIMIGDAEVLADFNTYDLDTALVGYVIFWGWVFFSNILMLNMLIAMFGNTFAMIYDSAADEARFKRYSMILLLEQSWAFDKRKYLQALVAAQEEGVEEFFDAKQSNEEVIDYKQQEMFEYIEENNQKQTQDLIATLRTQKHEETYRFRSDENSDEKSEDLQEECRVWSDAHDIQQGHFEQALYNNKFTYWLNSLDRKTVHICDVEIRDIIMDGFQVESIFARANLEHKVYNTPIPGYVLLKGHSVSVLVLLTDQQTGQQFMVLKKQLRVTTGRSVLELPVMLLGDHSGSLEGIAAEALMSELDINIKFDELRELTSAFTNPDACDEKISLFYYEQQVSETQIKDFQNRSMKGKHNTAFTLQLWGFTVKNVMSLEDIKVKAAAFAYLAKFGEIGNAKLVDEPGEIVNALPAVVVPKSQPSLPVLASPIARQPDLDPERTKMGTTLDNTLPPLSH